METKPEIPQGNNDRDGFTIDAGAFLAYFRGSPNAGLVKRALRQCQDLGVNARTSPLEMISFYAQVLKERPERIDDVIAIVSQLPIAVEPLTQDTVMKTLEIIMSKPDLSPPSAMLLAISRNSKTYLLTERNDLSGQDGVLLLHQEEKNAIS